MTTINPREMWAPVPLWESFYHVSTHGRIKRIAGGSRAQPGHILSLKLSKGYHQVCLSRPPKDHKWKAVHRLVLEAFLGPCPPRHECDHIDGNRLNNHLSNLRWVTKSFNQQSMFDRHGGAPWSRGELHPRSKLNDQQARLILWCQKLSIPPGWRVMLASTWGVNESTIRSITYGANFKHLTI